jgi:hypothetical protein
MGEKKFEIPSDNKLLKDDILKNKKKYMDHVLSAFEEITKADKFPSKLNLFNFSNTNLEVIIKKESYLSNLNNLLDYYSELEEYELCNTISNLIKYIKNNSNSEDL